MSKMRLVRHSIRAVGRYKLRSGFIMLGTLVGVAALTLVISVGGGVERKMLTMLKQLFGESSILVIGRGNQLLGGPRPNAARFTIDDMTAVANEVPEIEAWDPQQSMPSASIRRDDASTTARVLGASERWTHVWERHVSRGDEFDASAVTSSARVALIGETVARELFAHDDPIGADILIGSVSFRVIGVLERFGTDLHGMDRDNEIVVPISTLQRRVMNVDTIGIAKILVRDPSRAEETAQAIKQALRARHALAEGQRDDFNLMTPIEVQQMVSFVQRILYLYMPLVAGVAILVAGIVSATLMLASVNQRRGEIGLRRAVGARPEDIRLQFLIETAVTTLAGGIGGIAIGLFGAQGASVHLRLGALFSWNAILLGLLVSVATGLLAGVMPARRAAKLPPVDALR
jgi:putative ABC transport system permease protein